MRVESMRNHYLYQILRYLVPMYGVGTFIYASGCSLRHLADEMI